jgi:hypothetical protein
MALFHSSKRLAPFGGPAEPQVAHRRIPLNKLLLRTLIGWQSGEQEIYQPLGLPKVQQTWKLLRKLSDRLDKMARFLRLYNSTLSEQVRYWT